MALIKKILIPNRYDCLYVVIGILCFLTIVMSFMACLADRESLDYFLADSWGFLVGVPGSCLFAIGAVIGLKRASWRRPSVLAGVAFVLPVLAVVGYFWLNQTPLVLEILELPQSVRGIRNNQTSSSNVIVWGLYAYSVLIASPLVAWLLFRSICKGPERFKTLVLNRFKMTRPHLLMVVAAVLFVAGVVSNLIELVVPGFKLATTGPAIGILVILVLFGLSVLLLYYSTRFLAGRVSGWFKSLVSILVLTLVGGITWLFDDPMSLAGVFFEYGWVILAVVLYGLCVVAVSGPSRRGPVDEDAEEPNSSGSIVDRVPCLATIVFLLFLAGVVWFPFRYDISTLAMGGGLQNAKNEATLRWRSNGQFRHYGFGGSFLLCEFDESTAPDVFKLLGDDLENDFEFTSVSRQIDFSLIGPRDVPISVRFSGGTVTRRQLNDLFAQPVDRVVFDGVEIVDSGEAVNPRHIQTLIVSYRENGTRCVGNVLAAVGTFENIASISLWGNVDATDWPVVAKASRLSLVNIWGDLPIGLSQEEMALGGESILSDALFESITGPLTRRQADWLEWSKISFRLGWDASVEDAEFILDLTMAYPGRFNLVFEIPLTGDLDLADPQTPDYFVFERDSEGRPTGVCLPFGESNRGVYELSELKTLSFDAGWIQRRYEIYEELESADFTGLPNLECLAFSSTSLVEEIDFLSGMKSLRRLQIPAIDRSSGLKPGFDSCPGLETITIFGRPDGGSIYEFKRLLNLKKLTIVDVDGDFAALLDSGFEEEARVSGWVNRDDFLGMLKSLLPNVEITIVDETDFTPDIPESYLAFRKRNQILARQKLRDQIVE